MIFYSIIIAVYNVEKYLEECLDSVLTQTYTNWEAILVNDGSTDANSGTICDRFAQIDKRFKVFHRKNEGSLVARRFGLSQAKGEYVLFIDSDDYIHKDLLSIVNRIIEKNACDLVIYRFESFGETGRIPSEILFQEGTIIGEGGLSKDVIWKKLVSGGGLNNLCLKVAKREHTNPTADFSEYAFLKSGTDLIQSLTILDNAKKIYYTEKVLYYYRYNSSGISSTKMKKTDLESIKKHLETRRVLFNERYKYLEKNIAKKSLFLKPLYAQCFRGGMEILISWFANEKRFINKKNILSMTLREKDFIKGREVLQAEDFSGRYRVLFNAYQKSEKQLLVVLTIFAWKVKVGAMLYHIKNFSINLLKGCLGFL